MKTHWKKTTNPNYLGSWDFQPGEIKVLTIKNVVIDKVFNQQENKEKECTVAHFTEKEKPLILNKTNMKTITKLYGSPYIEDWSNKKIALHTEKVKAFGKIEDAVRVKSELPKTETVKCHDCGKDIAPFKNYTAQQIAGMSTEKYGVPVCVACGERRKESESK